ncbi:MAG: DUF507 family protein [bacterium]
MKLSEDRISHLSHLILNQLLDRGLVFMREDDEPTVRELVKKVFVKELRKGEALDEKIREKIASYKRTIPEGSGEWHVLYQRFLREEKTRKGTA